MPPPGPVLLSHRRLTHTPDQHTHKYTPNTCTHTRTHRHPGSQTDTSHMKNWLTHASQVHACAHALHSQAQSSHRSTNECMRVHTITRTHEHTHCTAGSLRGPCPPFWSLVTSAGLLLSLPASSPGPAGGPRSPGGRRMPFSNSTGGGCALAVRILNTLNRPCLPLIPATNMHTRSHAHTCAHPTHTRALRTALPNGWRTCPALLPGIAPVPMLSINSNPKSGAD